MKAVRPPDPNASKARFRRKVNASSPPTALEIHGIRIHFPFRPYECQEAYMTKVMEALIRSENALLESPTGTGKTLCLLCAALAWQKEQRRLIGQQSEHPPLTQNSTGVVATATHTTTAKVPVIIYASRTHSQLSQVVRELRNTRYRPNHAVLGSREQMCIHPKVKTANATSSDINHKCSKLGKERKCRFRNNVEGFVAPSNEEGGGGCTGTQPVMDMEDLVTMGKSMNVCPFYYTRNQLAQAELILVPYNYLFDKDARGTLSDISWENAVIIFDEAHNLESFASESSSFDLSYLHIAGCMREIDTARALMQGHPDGMNGLTANTLDVLKVRFKQLEDYVEALGPQCSYMGEFIFELFQRGMNINHANHAHFLTAIQQVNDYMVDMRGQDSKNSKSNLNLEHFASCLKRAFDQPLESRCFAKAAFYRIYVSPKPTSKSSGRTVSYWCFAPSLAMEELASLRVRSIIVTSGTLSPLPSYSMELGLNFPHTLENPHIIDSDQIHVRVIGKGVSGKTLTSSYQRRQDAEYYNELGNTLVSLAKVIPAGVLVFFPSYSAMEACLERWGGPVTNRPQARDGRSNFFVPRQKQLVGVKNYSFPFAPVYFDSNISTSLWKRLVGTKAVVVEPKSSTDLHDAVSEFQKFLALPKSTGCIFMGVCRGKISEGIDFAHEQSRAVVITGLPFPPTFDPKVKMKQEYLDHARAAGASKASSNGGFGQGRAVSSTQKLSGHDWYTQQAHRAVNQAIGRVIRNRSDYGAVLLLDERFHQTSNQEGLSKWLRPHIRKDEGFGAAVSGLASFYKDADVKVQKLNKEEANRVVLEYEEDPDDSSDERFTKVVVVKDTRDASEATTLDDQSASDSFLPADQIIARVDVKDLKDAPVPPTRTNETVACKASVFERSSAFASKPSTNESKQSETGQQRAASFFDLAKEVLSSHDLRHLKKTIATMVAHGKNMDDASYLKSAREVVALLVRSDRSCKDRGGRPDLILLFFPLLPTNNREDVEITAFKELFDTSSFGSRCKENLAPGVFGLVRSYVVPLLHSLWCSRQRGEVAMKKADYIKQAEAVLKVLFNKMDKGVVGEATREFNSLIPVQFISTTSALVDEISAAVGMKELKAKDRVTGHQTMLADKFLHSAATARPSNTDTKLGDMIPARGQQSSSPMTAPVAKPTSHAAAASAGKGGSLKRKQEEAGSSFSNPYVRKPSTKSEPSNQTKSRTSALRNGEIDSLNCKQEVGPSFSNPYVRKLSSKLEPSTQTTSLTALLQEAESDTFVKKSSSEIVKDLSSYDSKAMDCPLCSSSTTNTFVAHCGHTACLRCWQSWLKKSPTCPTCRAETTNDSLARIVIAQKSATDVAAARGLSDVAAPAKPAQATDDDSSDGELELDAKDEN